MRKRFTAMLIILTVTGSLFGQQPNTGHAYLKSIILPGWGESAYGSNSAYVFLAAELALWTSFGGLRYSAAVQDQDIIAYSMLHAGVVNYPGEKEYWSDLGNYISWSDHRETMLENRTPHQIWNSDYAWEWDSSSNAQTYKILFRKKELTLIGSEFIIAGMLVNRIASVINIKYLENKQLQLHAIAGPTIGGAYMQVGLSF